jgi:predicted secreted protein
MQWLTLFYQMRWVVLAVHLPMALTFLANDSNYFVGSEDRSPKERAVTLYATIAMCSASIILAAIEELRAFVDSAASLEGLTRQWHVWLVTAALLLATAVDLAFYSLVLAVAIQAPVRNGFRAWIVDLTGLALAVEIADAVLVVAHIKDLFDEFAVVRYGYEQAGMSATSPTTPWNRRVEL